MATITAATAAADGPRTDRNHLLRLLVATLVWIGLVIFGMWMLITW